MIESDIPGIIVGRLPIYLQALEHLQARGVLSTSSQELGEIIGISAAQIRKDLSQFGEFGKQGKGYAISYLVDQLRGILHVNRLWDIAVIGAGNLGRAIAHYQSFMNHGFRIAMIFDKAPERIGTEIGDMIVQDSRDMIQQLQNAGIKIAMLTVPAAEAQAVTNELIKAGVKAILNYAPITLSVPSDVHVQHVDPVIYLQKMTYYLD
jgi:redox-sensing transcriptional repressor